MECVMKCWAVLVLVAAGRGLAREAPEAWHALPEDRPALAQQASVPNSLLAQHPDLTPHGFYEAVIKLLQFTNSNSDVIACVMDTLTVLNATSGGIKDGMWAMKMLDSSSKLIQSGILEGNIKDLGQFDECIYAQNGDIAGQHCYAAINFKFNKLAPDNILNELNGVLSYRMSYCVPNKCKPEHIRSVLRAITKEMTTLLNSSDITVSASLPDNHCKTAHPPAFDALDTVVIIILAVILLITAAAAVLDYCLIKNNLKHREPTAGEKLIQAISIYSNGLKLFNTKQVEGQMYCINGIKFLSITWVLLGHRTMLIFNPAYPAANYFEIKNVIQEWRFMVIIHGILSVDTFFVVSGLLNTYGICILRDRLKRFTIFNALHLIIHRYIRLTPAYLVVIAMTATIQKYIGNGPVWDETVLGKVAACRKYWWTNLIYLNNYIIPSIDLCVMQSWYLSADMQLFILSPLIVLPLWKWPKLGYCLLVILGGASIGVTFWSAYYYKITTTIPLKYSVATTTWELDVLYTPTHLRIISYVIGIYIGYILYRMRVKKDMKLNISQWTNLFLWLLTAVGMLFAIFGGHYLYKDTMPWNLIETSLFIGTFRCIWSLGVAWLILACCQGYGGLINKFLSLNIFGPLARLTYGMYLCHIFVFLYKVGSAKEPVYLTFNDLLTDWLGETILIMMLAVVLTLTSESPIIMIEKLTLEKRFIRRDVDGESNKRKNSLASLRTVDGKQGITTPTYVSPDSSAMDSRNNNTLIQNVQINVTKERSD